MDTKQTNPKDRIGCRKAGMSCVPANVLAELGVAMTEGALKYGPYNYREAGVRASVYYDALMRHMFAWWEGEDIDPDSGVSHVTKAVATLVVLRDAMVQDMVTDDRPPKAKPFYPEMNTRSGELMDKHAEAVVRDGTAALKVELAEPNLEGDWCVWAGGRRPLPYHTQVEVLLRGVEVKPHGFAGGFYWEHLGEDVDIVAYKVLP